MTPPLFAQITCPPIVQKNFSHPDYRPVRTACHSSKATMTDLTISDDRHPQPARVSNMQSFLGVQMMGFCNPTPEAGGRGYCVLGHAPSVTYEALQTCSLSAFSKTFKTKSFLRSTCTRNDDDSWSQEKNVKQTQVCRSVFFQVYEETLPPKTPHKKSTNVHSNPPHFPRTQL